MNLLGMGFAIKGINNMTKSRGSGHSSLGPSQEELFLKECRATIKALETKKDISGKEVPAITLKGSTRFSPAKRKEQKLHNIQIISANQNGVKIDGLSIDLSGYSVVGTIDGSRFFALDKITKDLVVIDMTEYYSYGPHGDFFHTNNILNEEPKKDETSEISIDFKLVNENELKVGNYANMPQRRCYLHEIDKHPDIAGFYQLANFIRQNAKEKQASVGTNEMG